LSEFGGPTLACDLGGTRIKVGLVHDGQVLAQSAIPAESEKGLAPRLPALSAAFFELLKSRELRPESCQGVGVSFPSLVDNSTGRILAEFGKYRDAMAVDLSAWARREFGLPLAIENDARMALIGEWRHGAGRGCDNLVMMTLGTGIGTAALIEGRVLRGVHGQAVILGGHTTVRYGGRRCNCGNIGCAEAEASTATLSQLTRDRADFAGSSLARESTVDFSAVFRHASSGDACAAAIRDHSLGVWSSLAVNLIQLFDPAVLIVGGGIMGSGEAILSYMREHIDKFCPTYWGKVTLAASQLGDAAALLACEWLVQEHLKTS
jgi:glucokinase